AYKGLRGEPHEIEIVRYARDRGFSGLRHNRLEALDLAQHRRGVKQEIAAVPEVAIGHIRRCGSGIWLLDEGVDRTHGCAVELFAGTDIAVAGTGTGGLDAKGYDPPLGRGRRRASTGIAEFFGLANDVIGREYQHQGITVALGREHGGNRDRRPGVASHWLEHDVRLDAALAQLLRHHEA